MSRSFLSTAHRLAAVALLAVALPSLPLAATISKAKVSFFAVGNPGFLDIVGETTSISLVDDGTKMTFSVPMNTLKTGIELRDEHMIEYAGAAKNPNAVLAFTKADIPWPAMDQMANGTVKGTFTVNGQAQPVDISYTVKRSSKGLTIRARFDYDITKSGINVPSYMGVTIEAKQHAEATLTIVDG